LIVVVIDSSFDELRCLVSTSKRHLTGLWDSRSRQISLARALKLWHLLLDSNDMSGVEFGHNNRVNQVPEVT
jgi:hypothetical protein